MKITVVGAGNAGTTVAADLSLKGHEVTILKTSNSLHNENFNTILNNGYKINLIRNNESREAKLHLVTTDFKEALEGSELIILYVQTNYQEDVIKRMSKYLYNQIILIEPGYLATLFFLKECKDKPLIYVEAESSPIDCRITKPGEVTAMFENVRNPIGIYPKSRTKEALEKLELLQYNFVPTKNIVEAALHNPNLIVHTIGAFMSIPRIEYTDGKEYWMYKEVFTKSVWNMVNGLDKEKMDIMERLGCERISYVEACKFRNSLISNMDAEAVFFDYAKNHSTSGPYTSDSRYITEDVPEGLVLMESLGKYLEIDTPVCTSLIELSSSSLNRDFRTEGRTIARIGIENFKAILEI
ncbi:NAD/NADP octopine/nopaline dehydrogenase family protein [Clostridium gasigenes]|uniref:NAD/NADP octopine/nopaline dehydrogenase family protein n=1 Tax=Clostridium gasigenes TaxID=94869 RepID=UPI0016249AD0|nr:NAD/NADP octopine/nopaline dehydrogenase family protein [Clostridium gasigenes]MBB6624664.1 NAD/NADP octopine/nopaline dehydrogenase family protein [Clostridium gasigenes]